MSNKNANIVWLLLEQRIRDYNKQIEEPDINFFKKAEMYSTVTGLIIAQELINKEFKFTEKDRNDLVKKHFNNVKRLQL